MENKISAYSMNTYSLRLDEKQDYQDFILEHQDALGKMFVIKHQGKRKNNPHFHFAIRTDTKKDAMRKRLKNIFTKGKGNGHMSLKDWDGEDVYIQYLLHECRDINEVKEKIIIDTIGYDDETLVRLLARSKNIQEKLKENNPTNVVQLVIDRLVQEEVMEPTKGLVFHMIMDWYGKQEGKWYPNRFQMDNYITYIMGTMARIADAPSGGDEHWDKFKEAMWAKYDGYVGYERFDNILFHRGLRKKNLRL